MPLTELTKKTRKFVWGEKEQKPFEKVKTDTCKAIMLAYPDCSKECYIYANSSDHTIGTVLVQDEKVITTFSKKMSRAQLNYPMTEKELLALTEGLKYFSNVIYGCRVMLWTDHKNLCHEDMKHVSQQALHQQIVISEELGAKLRYIDWDLNLGSEGLTRLRMSPPAKESCENEIFT